MREMLLNVNCLIIFQQVDFFNRLVFCMNRKMQVNVHNGGELVYDVLDKCVVVVYTLSKRPICLYILLSAVVRLLICIGSAWSGYARGLWNIT